MNWLIKISGSGLLVVYHATIAGRSIVNNGFKTRDQLSGRSALGGGISDGISFTTDWNVAKGIFDGFILAWEIANAPNQFEFIRNHFYSLKPDIQKKVLSMLVAIQGGSVDKYFDYFMNGWIPDGVFSFRNKYSKGMNKDEIHQRGFKVIPDESPNENGIYYSWLEPMDDKQKMDFLYSYLKAYHSGGGVYDPVFFGSSIKNFQNVDREDIGIITAQIEIDPNFQGQDDFHQNQYTYRYVSSMAEIRVFNTSIIKSILDFDPDPKSYKTQTNQFFYSSKENIETGINILLRYIYEHYNDLDKLFKSKNIAIDQVISLIQFYGHDQRNFWSLINTIGKNLDFNKYVLFEYIKYYNKIKIDNKIKILLEKLPNLYRQKVMNGERFYDVASDMYDNNKEEYDKWWSANEDPYEAEQILEDWTKHRKEYLRYYEQFAKQFETEIKAMTGDLDPNILAGFVKAMESCKEHMSR